MWKNIRRYFWLSFFFVGAIFELYAAITEKDHSRSFFYYAFFIIFVISCAYRLTAMIRSRKEH